LISSFKNVEEWSNDGGLEAIMWSRSLRMLRFLRLMRMLRMVKLRRINEVFQEFFQSQVPLDDRNMVLTTAEKTLVKPLVN
jgi:hypothetical protein